MDTHIALLFVVGFGVSILCSAFFSGAETALLSLGRIDMQRLREKGGRRAVLVRSLKAHTPRLLATILIGQNLFNNTASALATALATAWLGDLYGLPVAILFSTIMLFAFAEMLPKALGVAAPAAVSRAVAVPLSAIMRLASPFTDIFVGATTRLLALVGLRETQAGLTEDELKSVFNLGADEGVIHGEERRRLHKVIEFGDKTVRDIMVPRTKIVALPETASFRDVRLVFSEHKLSRLPIYRGNLDNIVGILRAKDLFDVTDEGEGRFDLPKYLHPPLLVPQFKPAEDVFREMRRRRTHMAIVVDEFGGTAGLATLEDAIEELLGSIQDEYDVEETPGYLPASDRAFLLDGTLRLEDLEERLGIALPREEADTIAGHLLLRFGRIPGKGERWRGRFADFVVEEATPTTIKKVRMILPERKS
ncbi:MAG TPA: hemolysin family protein [Thermoanaerobaculia bacterium]|nr:hemolysin family protein [Thermoanaerobaculia bacterium]